MSDEPNRGVNQREDRNRDATAQFGPDSDQSILTGLPTLVSGALLGGHYRLGTVVGHIGPATRWVAVDENLSRSVFVTAFPHTEATDSIEAAVQRAARTTDDRALEVFDTGHESDTSYIVTEWVDGRTLTEVLRQGPLTPEIAASVVRDVASSLANIHSVGVCHGHVTPGSVYLTTSGSVRIGGLCVDRALTARPGEERLSPANQVAVDVAACGGLLYACLTGTWPGGESLGLPASPRDSSGLRPPAAIRPGTPPALDQMTRQILSPRDPHHLSSAQAVASALGTWLGPTDISGPLSTRVRCTPSFNGDDRPAATGVHRPRILPAPTPATASVVGQITGQNLPDDGTTAGFVPLAPDSSGAHPTGPTGGSMGVVPLGGGIAGSSAMGTTELAAGATGVAPLGETTAGATVPTGVMAVSSDGRGDGFGGASGGQFAGGADDGSGFAADAATDGFGAASTGGLGVGGAVVGVPLAGQSAPALSNGGATGFNSAVAVNDDGSLGAMSPDGVEMGPGADTAGTVAPPDGTTRHLKPPMTAKRARVWSRMTVILAVVIVVALITGLVLGLYNSATNRAAAPVTPSPTVTLTPRPISGATVIDAEADGGSGLENDEEAPLAYDGDPATAWMTEVYVEPIIPEKKPGVGLIFDLGAATSVSQATITVQQMPITVSLYIPKDPTAAATADPDASTIANWTAVVSHELTEGTTTVDFSAVTSRYVAVYITKVVDLGDGQSQADLAEVSFAG